MSFTLANVIRTHGRERPDAPCLTFADTTLTYADLDRRSNRVARSTAHSLSWHG